ncbi:MAG TPA: class II aldolase/adducin family protein [Methylotenera sp.]|nr:class II aldolase/adducin family protein [Methylotenera sp.]HPH04247.1 class II aldolase/adducin family protein [Methylotenera sp.]HPM99801.1 class II aldolase/adducin family protein [Methylotenera sp.]
MQIDAEKLLNTSQKLANLGLNKGTSGNASVRVDGGFLITPSGLSVEQMSASDMVNMHLDGTIADSDAGKKPSSEWRFHRDILANRPEINAVIHTHSMFATTLACLHKDIPPFHYMIAVAGGDTIRCAPYALFGSQALSDVALLALQERKACLLANHGMIALGRDCDEALAVAQEVENLCEQYWRTLQLGEPHILSEAEMREVFQQFKGYGRWAQ